mmetsp:Transcript_11551/g.20459  ORF Transcript_11551/g.20459 Transcript_11551/m.20459 type:complete len:120 (+) Transcript_11551:51-410(+)
MSLTLADECQAWKDTIKKEMFMQADNYSSRDNLTNQRTRMSLTGSLLLDRPGLETPASSMRSWRSNKKGMASTYGGSSRPRDSRMQSPAVLSRVPSRGGAPLMRRTKSSADGLFGPWMP